MKWILGCIITAALLAGCGSSNETSAKKDDESATSPSSNDSSIPEDPTSKAEDNSSTVDACAFLSKEEASTLSGLEVTTTTPANSGKTAGCTYTAEGREVALVYVYPPGTDLPFASEPIPELGEKSNVSPTGAGFAGSRHTYQVGTGVAGGKVLTRDEDRLPANTALLLKVLENAGEK